MLTSLYKYWKKDSGQSNFPIIVKRFLVSVFYHPIYRFTHSQNPFFVRSAIKEIEKFINQKSDLKVFEYGSGKSSLWWLRHVDEYYGVEHNESWYNRVVDMLEENNFDSNKHILFKPMKPMKNDSYPSNNGKMNNSVFNDFSKYLNAIDQFEEAYFDIIIIDGRKRVRSAERAYSKLKPGGYLILDDSNRLKYRKVFQDLISWDYTEYGNGWQRTTIFKKPKNIHS
jgi:hypothetical protein